MICLILIERCFEAELTRRRGHAQELWPVPVNFVAGEEVVSHYCVERMATFDVVALVAHQDCAAIHGDEPCADNRVRTQPAPQQLPPVRRIRTKIV